MTDGMIVWDTVQSQYCRVTTTARGTLMAELPDGSRLHLNETWETAAGRYADSGRFHAVGER